MFISKGLAVSSLSLKGGFDPFHLEQMKEGKLNEITCILILIA